MPHSTLTKKGQTTIPNAVRDALRMKPGDRLKHEVEGERAIVRAHPGTQDLKSVLASEKGRGITMARIREAAAAIQRRGNVARGKK